jgi:hypothetical protein
VYGGSGRDAYFKYAFGHCVIIFSACWNIYTIAPSTFTVTCCICGLVSYVSESKRIVGVKRHYTSALVEQAFRTLPMSTLRWEDIAR